VGEEYVLSQIRRFSDGNTPRRRFGGIMTKIYASEAGGKKKFGNKTDKDDVASKSDRQGKAG